MLAVKGIYDNGKITLNEKMSEPKSATEVLVIFPDQEKNKTVNGLSMKEKKQLFEEFSGSINRIIDINSEKMEALDKKYEDTY